MDAGDASQAGIWIYDSDGNLIDSAFLVTMFC
jgi:hypothetical protein